MVPKRQDHRDVLEMSSKRAAAIQAVEHYGKTGEVLDILLADFDQDGKWYGQGFFGLDTKNIPKDIRKKLKKEVLPKDRIEVVKPDGSIHLKTSFVCREINTKVPYHVIEGGLLAPGAVEMRAPKLQKVLCGIDLREATEAYLPKLESVGWSIWLNKAGEVDLSKLRKVGASLKVDMARELAVPNLEYVGWVLQTGADGKLSLEKLTEVGCHLLAPFAKEVNAPHLTTIEQDIKLDAAQKVHLPKLGKLGGILLVGKVEKLELPKLKGRCRSIACSPALSIYLPKLEEVEFDFDASSSTTIDCPKLSKVGGHIEAQSATKIDFEELTHLGDGVRLDSLKEVHLPKLETIGINKAVRPSSPIVGLVALNAETISCPKLQVIKKNPLIAPKVKSLKAPRLIELYGIQAPLKTLQRLPSKRLARFLKETPPNDPGYEALKSALDLSSKIEKLREELSSSLTLS